MFPRVSKYYKYEISALNQNHEGNAGKNFKLYHTFKIYFCVFIFYDYFIIINRLSIDNKLNIGHYQ